MSGKVLEFESERLAIAKAEGWAEAKAKGWVGDWVEEWVEEWAKGWVKGQADLVKAVIALRNGDSEDDLRAQGIDEETIKDAMFIK